MLLLQTVQRPEHVLAVGPADRHAPDGLARGRWPAPAWLVVALAAAVTVAAVALLVMRARRSRKDRQP